MALFPAIISLSLSLAAADMAGVVKDSKGGLLSGAVVSILDSQSQKIVKLSSSDERGIFLFSAIPAGRYDIKIECPGYLSVLKKNIEIAESKETRLDVLLTAADDPQPKTDENQQAVRAAGRDIVVTANKVEENNFESNRSVTVVSQTQLDEFVPRSTPEALMGTPGIFVQKTNNGGGTPYIRGLMGPQNLITIDGTRLNNSTYRSGPNQYLNLIDSLSLDRIEVLRGSGSVLYGSDAMGGVINLMTSQRRDQSERFNGRLVSRYESADEGKVVHGSSDIDLGGLKLSLSGTARDFSNLRGGGDTGVQPHSSYNQQGATFGLTYDLPKNTLPGWWISAKYFFNQINDAGRADQLYTGKKWLSYTNWDHFGYVRLHMPLTNLATYGEFTVSEQSFFERIDNFKTGNDFVTLVQSATTRSDTGVKTLGFDLKFDTSLWRQFVVLRYGGMWYRDSVTSTNLNTYSRQTLVPPYPDHSSYATYGGYAMLDVNPLAASSARDLKLTAGLRWHGMSAFAPARAPIAGTEQTLNPEEVNAKYSGTVLFSSAQYVAKDAATFALTYSQGFRAPSLSEYVMFGDAGSYFQVPNPNLKPERSDTVEFLTKFQLKSLSFLRNVKALESFDLGVTVYQSKIKDLLSRVNTTWNGLSYVTATTPIQMNVNALRGDIRGAEIMTQIVLSSGFSLAANTTTTVGDEEDAVGVKQPMRKIAPLFGMVRLRWDSRAPSSVLNFLEVSVRAAAKQTRLNATDISDPRIPAGGTPGWWTLNFRTGLTIQKSLRVTIGLENLLDKKYKYHGSGVWSPGRDVIIATEILF